MKRLVNIVAFLLLAARADAGVKEAIYVLGASGVYVMYDYLLYANNQWSAGSAEEIAFRVSQLMLQGALTWFLAEECGIKAAIAFNVLWLTWNLDAAYYGVYDLFKGTSTWKTEVESNTVTWARHTPVGWFSSPQSARALKIQMSVGVLVSFIITI